MEIEYHQILTNKGFYCFEKCICSGVKIHKYKPNAGSPLYMDIKIFPDQKAFIIYKNGVRVSRGKLNLFEEELTKKIA